MPKMTHGSMIDVQDKGAQKIILQAVITYINRYSGVMSRSGVSVLHFRWAPFPVCRSGARGADGEVIGFWS